MIQNSGDYDNKKSQFETKKSEKRQKNKVIKVA